jgi:Protein of unknown function (DUF2852)
MPGRPMTASRPSQQEVPLTSISLTRMPQTRDDTRLYPAAPHLVVQILGLLLFGGFAIVATILALVFFLPAGIALAIFLVVYGFRPLLSHRHAGPKTDPITPDTAHVPANHTGNGSFDAYRADVLKRLEDEQTRFVSFLDRLRDAKDKSQFDTFMDDRATANRAADAALVQETPTQPGTVTS